MTITAKFAGKCKKCGGRIAEGDQIEWEKGVKGATCAACATKGADPEAELARREGADMTGRVTPERMAQIDANYKAAKGEPSAGELYPPHEPVVPNPDTIKASEVGWMIRIVGDALACAAGEYDLPVDDIERVKEMLGVLVADGIEHGRVIA